MNRFCELVREIYGPYFPTPRNKRENFMDKVRQSVCYYQPRIEERCKIKLGNVKIKDNTEWLHDVLFSASNQSTSESAWKQGRFPTKTDYRLTFLLSSIVESATTIPLWLYNSVHGADFRVFNNTLYVPFYVENSVMDMDFKKRLKRLDYCVVHELSHILWTKILGEEEGYSGLKRQWFEGFATYCADDYFADFYPEGTEKYSKLPRVYTDGKKKVEELVARYGKEIILQVPKRCKEFSN